MATANKLAVTRREHYAELILARLRAGQEQLTQEFRRPGRIASCFIDDVLPESLARQIFELFPSPAEMTERKTLREHKLVTAQMNRCHPAMEEIVFAFQDQRIVQTVREITGLAQLMPDENLYAGGISLMARDHFLNPHLDNSHDKDRNSYRVLNLLYYVTPDWSHEAGGNLELWDNGPAGEPREIVSKCNRLVLMATHKKSWHSVTQVKAVHAPRCCVSNYYFSSIAPEEHEYFHVTTFRGRPEQPLRNLVLRGDAALRMGIRKLFVKGIAKPKHLYRKDKP